MQKQIETKLVELLAQSTPENYQRGLAWYEVAHLHAQALSDEFELPLFKVCGVIAALSPNNKWERNLIDTRLFLANPSLDTKVCTFLGQRKKALRILLDASKPSEVKAILGGRKTISFYSNIYKFNTSKEVTVDLWMFRIGELKKAKKNYEVISDAVLEVSQENNMLPHQLQAIVWSVVRPN